MNTRVLQTLSMALLMSCGIFALYTPEVFLGALGLANVTPHWPVQLLAAGWLALAMFNWMTRGFTMGGIYGRPVVMTNFTFYFIVALTSLRPALANGRPGSIGVVVIFGIFAIAYGYLLLARGPSTTASTPT